MNIDDRLRIIAEKLLHPKLVRTVDSLIEYAELETEVLDTAVSDIKKVIAEELPDKSQGTLVGATACDGEWVEHMTMTSQDVGWNAYRTELLSKLGVK